ncbi:toll/interleukin-1 receptor domain-containing protein [Kaistella sp. G5-32]|uniref:Toll/interleukin-1 receptor domain-containing protein n=1 Tax=Kaistella gelatinilytica TaxID=2787636 RepID=A0ABS0FAJ5_9FLAO|nr:toll/interleukin-1 receptor domain-containing protein [Kaistella gelatinilytica]MBF8456713.1 toll/interleukin-1 receptor domain-containing protein [Kaistella gelatinilytica]
MITEHKFQYYAFISYSSEDAKWAKWLQTKLENYRIPNFLSKEKQAKYLRPIFRDKSDIGLGRLEQNLSKEIEDSRFLIVICSPKASISPWVKKEIARFKELGGENRIIPFIIEGSPNPKLENQKNCYPDELSKDILGASLNELTKEEAFIKIVAFILGLRFDVLWQRHEREKKRKRKINHTFLAILIPLVLFSIFKIWDYNRVKSKFYSNYVDKFGIPNGIFELSKEQITHKNSHYRFQYRRNKLIAVEHLNSSNILTDFLLGENQYRPVLMNLFYNEDGTLNSIDYSDLHRIKLARIIYSGSKKNEIDIKTPSGSTAVLNANQTIETGSPIDIGLYSKSLINHISLIRDNQGYIYEEKYSYGGMEPINDLNGIYGKKYIRDQQGQILKETFLDHRGQPMNNAKGIGITNYKYEEGNLVQISYYNYEGKPILNNENGHKIIFHYDLNKNIDFTSSFNIENNKFQSSDGTFGCKYEYNEKGEMTLITFLNTFNNPINNIYGYAYWNLTYNDNGQEESNSFFNKDYKPTVRNTNTEQTHKVVTHYDNFNNIIRIEHFDISGSRTNCAEGYSVLKRKSSKNGLLIEEETYNGKLEKIELNGYFLTKNFYDENSFLIKVQTFDKRLMPSNSDKGYSIETRSYDNRGNPTKFSYYDKNDLPINILGNYQTIKQEFNKSGNIEWIRLFDDKNKRTENEIRVSTIHFSYNKFKLVNTQYFDKKNKELKLE